MYITQNGYAFAEAPELNGGLYTKFFVEDSNPVYDATFPYPTMLRGLPLYKEAFGYVYNSKLRSITYTHTIDRVFEFADGARILTTTDSSLDFIKERLRSIFAMQAYNTLVRDGFTQIDLRFGDRVYVQKDAVLGGGTGEGMIEY